MNQKNGKELKNQLFWREDKKGTREMTAYELADIVDHWAYKESAEYLTDAATMLRQQQAEIEALKAVLEQEGIGVGRDLLNGGIALFRKAKNEQ